MDYNELQRHIGKAGLKLKEFAYLMQMNNTSLSNYRKTGEVPRHLAIIAMLLGEMADRGIDYRALLERLETTPKAAPSTDDRKAEIPQKMTVHK